MNVIDRSGGDTYLRRKPAAEGWVWAGVGGGSAVCGGSHGRMRSGIKFLLILLLPRGLCIYISISIACRAALNFGCGVSAPTYENLVKIFTAKPQPAP